MNRSVCFALAVAVLLVGTVAAEDLAGAVRKVPHMKYYVNDKPQLPEEPMRDIPQVDAAVHKAVDGHRNRIHVPHHAKPQMPADLPKGAADEGVDMVEHHAPHHLPHHLHRPHGPHHKPGHHQEGPEGHPIGLIGRIMHKLHERRGEGFPKPHHMPHHPEMPKGDKWRNVADFVKDAADEKLPMPVAELKDLLNRRAAEKVMKEHMAQAKAAVNSMPSHEEIKAVVEDKVAAHKPELKEAVSKTSEHKPEVMEAVSNIMHKVHDIQEEKPRHMPRPMLPELEGVEVDVVETIEVDETDGVHHKHHRHHHHCRFRHFIHGVAHWIRMHHRPVCLGLGIVILALVAAIICKKRRARQNQQYYTPVPQKVASDQV